MVVEFVGCCLPSPEGGAYQTVGQGDAWVFSDGKLVKGKWARSDRSQPTQYVDAAGAPIKLTPGRTWVEFVPAGLDYPSTSPPRRRPRRPQPQHPRPPNHPPRADNVTGALSIRATATRKLRGSLYGTSGQSPVVATD